MQWKQPLHFDFMCNKNILIIVLYIASNTAVFVSFHSDKRSVNNSWSKSISMIFIDSNILEVWPIVWHLFIFHVIISIIQNIRIVHHYTLCLLYNVSFLCMFWCAGCLWFLCGPFCYGAMKPDLFVCLRGEMHFSLFFFFFAYRC